MKILRCKGSPLASFLFCLLFLLPSQSEGSTPSRNNIHHQLAYHNAANTPLWQALLQLKQGVAINPNYTGYLVHPVSASAELTATVNLIFEAPQKACQYPARKRFIEITLGLAKDTLNFAKCSDYRSFRNSVPTDEAYLVFAAENVTSASSMMGHIMLRFDGANTEGTEVQHGITFFTELDSLNIPVLLYDTLVQGKPGVFQVAPYAPFQQHYRQTEQRNVWEYKLDLSATEKSLIAGMIWELGQFNPDYFFHSYNCATVTRLLLTLARPPTLAQMDTIVTPSDVVRFALKNDLVAQTQLLPSHKWKAQSLAQSLSADSAQKIVRQLIKEGSPALNFTRDSQSFLRYEFAQSVNIMLRQRNLIGEKRHHANIQRLQPGQAMFAGMALDVSNYKNPVNTSEESMLAIGVEDIHENQSLTFRYFPVASDINSDHRNYSGETALSLADIKIRYTPSNTTLHLDKLMLYSMTSRVPFNAVYGDISTGLQVGLNRVFDNHLQRKLVAQAEMSGGFTFPIAHGGVYIENGVGISADNHRVQAYLEPRTGGYVYLRNNIKVHIEAAWGLNKYDGSSVGRINTSVTHFISKSWSVNAFWSRLISDRDASFLTLNLRHRF